MLPPRGHNPPPPPFGVLVASANALYTRAFGPLVLTAIPGFLVANLLDAVFQPVPATGQLSWSAVVWAIVFVIPALVGQAAVTVLAFVAMRGQRPSVAVAYLRAIVVAPRYLGATAVAGLVLSALTVIVVGIPLAVVLLVRWSLYGPAIIVEGRPLMNALSRSFGLVQNRWLYTLAITIAGGVITLGTGLLAEAALDAINAGTVLRTTIGTATQAFTMPYAVVLNLCLFEEYRRIVPPDERPARG